MNPIVHLNYYADEPYSDHDWPDDESQASTVILQSSIPRTLCFCLETLGEFCIGCYASSTILTSERIGDYYQEQKQVRALKVYSRLVGIVVPNEIASMIYENLTSLKQGLLLLKRDQKLRLFRGLNSLCFFPDRDFRFLLLVHLKSLAALRNMSIRKHETYKILYSTEGGKRRMQFVDPDYEDEELDDEEVNRRLEMYWRFGEDDDVSDESC